MKTLKQFFQAYIDWVDADAPQHDTFTRRYGLCTNLNRWSGHDQELRQELRDLLTQDFGTAHKSFGEHYDEESRNSTMHLNEARINWVRKQLGEKTMKHPQADMLIAIANGEQMQVKSGNTWIDAPSSEVLRIVQQGGTLRIKPRTIKINGKELAGPITKPPEMGTEYHTLLLPSMYTSKWENDATDNRILSKGLAFASEEDAQAVVDAFKEILKGELK